LDKTARRRKMRISKAHSKPGKGNVIQLRPTPRGGRGKSPVPGRWVSINRRNGYINFSHEVIEACGWIEAKLQVSLDFDPDRNELRIFPDEEGFTINARKVNDTVRGYGIHVKSLTGIDFSPGVFNLKGGTFARFTVRVLKTQLVIDLVPKEQG
jgi:hypothetical protein